MPPESVPPSPTVGPACESPQPVARGVKPRAMRASVRQGLDDMSRSPGGQRSLRVGSRLWGLHGRCLGRRGAETLPAFQASEIIVVSTDECRAKPGEFAPVVDRARCEGKAECVEVCPYDVFEVRRMDDADFARFGPLGKLKSLAHRRQTAYSPRASA